MLASERLAQHILKWRWVILVTTLLLVGAMASGGRFLTFSDNYRDYFSPENPDLVAYEALQNIYTKTDNVLFLVAPKDGQVFTRQTLDTVVYLTQAGWKLPYAIRVDSVTNFQHTRADGDDLVVSDLVENVTTLSDAEIAQRKAIALDEPLLRNSLLPSKADVTGVNVTFEMPESQDTALPEIMAAVRHLSDTIRARDPNIEIHLGGMVTVNAAFMEHAMGDGKNLMPVVFGVMLVVTALTLRSFSGTLGTLLVITLSVASALGMAGWLGIGLNGVSASAPTVILTLAVADSIHLLIAIFHGMRGGMPKRAAIAHAIETNVGAIFLTTLDTVIGFLMFNFSEVPPYRDLGNIVAMGIAGAFLFSIFFLPALLSVLPLRVRPAAAGSEGDMMIRFADWVIARRRPLTWGVSLVAVVLMTAIPRNTFNDDFFKYFDKSTTFRQDIDFITDHTGAVYQLDYSLSSGTEGGITDPAYLARLEAFVAWYRSQPEVTHVTSLVDVMKRLNKNLQGDDPAAYRLPTAREEAAQYLLLFEMSLPFGQDLNALISVDKSASRLVALLKNISSNEAMALDRRAQQWLRDHAPATMQARGTGPTILFAEIGRRNTQSMIRGDIIGVILISGVMIVALRSVKFGLLTLIPNLVPLGMSLGIWGLWVGRVGMDVGPVTAMTFGLLVDDTVHNMTKYLHARRKLGMDPEAAIRYTFSTVGWAMGVASLILVAGFLVLTFSVFQFNVTMGRLTAITIVLALATEYLLLPPLLLAVDKKP